MIIPGESPLSDPLTIWDLAARQNREGLSVADAVKMLKL